MFHEKVGFSFIAERDLQVVKARKQSLKLLTQQLQVFKRVVRYVQRPYCRQSQVLKPKRQLEGPKLVRAEVELVKSWLGSEVVDQRGAPVQVNERAEVL